MNHHWQTVDQFSSQAEELRKVYDQNFAHPLEGHSERFVWDYWHVPDQYSLHRTPADQYFPGPLYATFEQELIRWGQKELGCSTISPPWLSYYVDGGYQKIHADSPHGPWAFVFSLTRWQTRQFSGGETFLLKPSTLDYWNDFSAHRGAEREQLLEVLPAEFNRLLVFDPRIPHGVETIQGQRDPRYARLVIHGWFTEPGPFFEGGLDEDKASETINAVLEPLIGQLSEMGRYDGLLTLRLCVQDNGAISEVRCLTNQLRAVEPHSEPREKLQALALESWQGTQFPSAQESSEITLPLIFEN